jgi:hypothetical protein
MTKAKTSQGAHRLQITVRDAEAVEVRNGKNHLGGVQPRQVLVKDALPVQLEEQVAAIHKVQHQVQLGRRLRSATSPRQALYFCMAVELNQTVHYWGMRVPSIKEGS